MDRSTLQRALDPFYSTKFLGRGLGLAAAGGIVEGHDGGIRIASEVGRGTTVTIVLPLRASPVADSGYNV
jgi:signal transduction histidine kinase